jgi:hypothetical protein
MLDVEADLAGDGLRELAVQAAAVEVGHESLISRPPALTPVQ